MINRLLPTHFISTLYEDSKTLFAYMTNKPGRVSFKESLPVDELEVYNLRKKTYAAAYRTLGVAAMGVSCLLAAKVILPIITFQFCVGAATAISLYVIGRDLFSIAKAREEKQNQKIIPEMYYLKDFFKVPTGVQAALLEDTLVPRLWKIIL